VCEACSSLLLKAYLAGRFTCICHLIFPPQHNTFTHRRSIAERGGCFSALSVCLFVCLHDNFRTIKRRTMKRLGALYKNLARVCMSRSKVKAQGRQGQKNEELLSHPHWQCIVKRSRLYAPYAARSSRRCHCVAARGDRVTAVHADGGLHERFSGCGPPVLRRWENQRMLSSSKRVLVSISITDL